MLEKLHDSIKSDDRQLQDVKNEMTEIIKVILYNVRTYYTYAFVIIANLYIM